MAYLRFKSFIALFNNLIKLSFACTLMDILAHGLWVAGIFRAHNLKKKSKNKLNIWKATFWGLFPDLFAFTIPFVILFYNLIFKHLSILEMPHPDSLEPSAAPAGFGLSHILYNYSHSIIIFLLVFLVVSLIFRRPVWVMSGWLIHILIDIPTHSYAFFPTPFLWPLSNLEVNGFSWGTLWFMILNYSALLIFYIFLYISSKKSK